MKSNKTLKTSTSIRAKVRIALAGVLLLLLPQVGLTVYYLVELSRTSANARSHSENIGALHDLVLATETVQRTAGNAGALSYVEDIKNQLTRIGAGLKKLTDVNVTSSEEALQQVNRNLDNWVEASQAQTPPDGTAASSTPPPIPSPTADPTVPLPIPQNPLPAQAQTRFEKSLQSLNKVLKQAEGSSRAELTTVDEAFVQIVDHANRNLLSLTMLTVIVVIGLIVVLPGRVVRPLRHLVDIIRKAEGGKYDVSADMDGKGDVGLISQAFNKTMGRIRDFDERKKDRIVEDGAKIDAMLRRFPHPAAILNTRHEVERANTHFRNVFGLDDGDADRPFPDVFAEGAQELQLLLDGVLQRRETVSDRRVSITSSQGNENDYMVSIDICKDRRGHPSHTLLLLCPSGAT